MTSEEYNAWAQEQNKQPGSHPNYYLSQPMAGGGTSSVQDPYYSSSEYINGPNSPYGAPPSEASLMWSSGSPNTGYYSPGGGGGWQEVNEGSLSDPAIAKMVADQAHNPNAGASSTYWNTMGAKIPEGVGLGPNETGSLMEGIGTNFSLAPEVLDKLWAPTKAPPPKIELPEEQR